MKDINKMKKKQTKKLFCLSGEVVKNDLLQYFMSPDI